MSPRKSLDADAEIAKLLARAEKLKTDQKLALGELVIETGIHKLLDADQLRDALLHLRDQVRVNPTAQGGRRDESATFPAPQGGAASRPNAQGLAVSEPARHRAPDLLAGTAPDGAGDRPVEEEPGLDRAS